MKHIGKNTIIHESASIASDHYYIGDNCYIGPNVNVTAHKFVLGDYSKIHNGTFVCSQPDKFTGGGVFLGHNNWIGQNAVIDGTGGFYAGNNLCVGISSLLYSHALFGDVLEGCNFCSASPIKIGNDVWFMGFCLVSPIEAKDKSMALLGSNVTKPMEENRIYAGNPAKDISDKVGYQFKNISVDEKHNMLHGLLIDFFNSNKSLDRDKIIVVDKESQISNEDEYTYINIADRKYTKKQSEEEISFLSWAVKYRAKFTPYSDELRIKSKYIESVNI